MTRFDDVSSNANHLRPPLIPAKIAGMSDERAHRSDDIHLPADASEDERRQAGDRLRERIYVTFTALAILMAMNSHGEALDSPTVLWTLVISVIGVLLAGLASDLVSHMIVHNTLPSAA